MGSEMCIRDSLRTKEFKKGEFKIIGFKEGSGDQKGAVIWKIECNKKGKYAQNKYLSVEYTKIMIINQQEIFKKLFDMLPFSMFLTFLPPQGSPWEGPIFFATAGLL